MHDSRTRKNLWFLAIIPPEPIRTEVWEMKLKMEAEYDSRKSLSSPPHITLLAPFKMVQQEIGKVERKIRDALISFKSFYIELDGFSSFPPRVIFVKPVKNKQLETVWQVLNKKLGTVISNQSRNDFNAHMTIATRDLRKDQYQRAAEYFLSKKYERIFMTEKVYLMKHNGQRWDIYGEYKFGKK